MKFGFVMLLSALSQGAAGGARLDFSLAALSQGGSATTGAATGAACTSELFTTGVLACPSGTSCTAGTCQ